MFEVEDGVLIKYRGNDELVKIPKGITSIEDDAFNHTSIRGIYIPKSITFIGFGAFDDCYNLANIYYEGNIEELNHIVIGEFNEAFFSSYVYCHLNVFLESDHKERPTKIRIEDIPKTYEELLKLDNTLYEITGEISNVNICDNLINITFNNLNSSAVINLISEEQGTDIINHLKTGTAISIIGSISYEIGYEKIVFCAIEIKTSNQDGE
jgi:hypothetical protein